MKKLFLLAIVALGFTAVSFGQQIKSMNGSAVAVVKTAVDLTQSTVLNFGEFTATSAGSVQVVTANNTPVFVGSGNAKVGGTVTSALFAVTGPISTIYTVTMPSTGIALTHTDGTTTMSITAWSNNVIATSATDEFGDAEFKVGGTLSFGAAQLVGSYSGSYPISVNFN